MHSKHKAPPKHVIAKGPFTPKRAFMSVPVVRHAWAETAEVRPLEAEAMAEPEVALVVEEGSGGAQAAVAAGGRPEGTEVASGSGSPHAVSSPSPLCTGTCVVTVPTRHQWYILDGADMQLSMRVLQDEHEHPVMSVWAMRADDPAGGLCVRQPLSLDAVQPVDLLARLVRWVPTTHLASVRVTRGHPRVAAVWSWADLHWVEWAIPSAVVDVGDPYQYRVWARDGTEVDVQSWHDDFVEAFLSDDLWLV